MTQAAQQASTTELNEGDTAPAFTLPANGDKTLSLSDFKGKRVVLYFYPKDNTPGCTIEANEFNALLDDFAAENTVILGVSKDSVASHDKFCGKFDLNFALVSDTEGTLCEAYGTWVEKSMYGRKYMGIDRATFLIDEQGTIRSIWRKVKAKKHAAEVLDAVRALNA